MLPLLIDKPMAARVSKVEPLAIELLPEVYQLLSDVVSTSAVHGDYVQTLLRVLEEAQLSEQKGASLALFPLFACQAAGGSPQRAIPVAAAWRALHIAAKLLDDVEDGALTLLPLEPARVVNVASGFMTLANLALARLARDYDERLWHSLQIEFSQTILRMAGGQDADLSHLALDLEHYFEIMADKSGSFFALAARAGARCATLDQSLLAQFESFGYNLGILIQIADDLVDMYQVGGDLAGAGKRTLPVVYALTVAKGAQLEELSELLAAKRASTDVQAEAALRKLLVGLGAEMYLKVEMARYKSRALAAIAKIPTACPLRDWLHLHPHLPG